MRDGFLPLTILGGFLGAGKSTWARHQLHEGVFRDHHLLVNEAAETPIDNLLLHKARWMEVLAGGCACCEGRAELIAALRRVCEARDAGRPVAGILLETSGLADPCAIARAIATDHLLARRIRLEESVVLVDARHGLEQLREEPLARAQVEAADRLILSKIPDGVAWHQTGRLIATLAHLNPAAAIEAAEFGVSVSLPEGEPAAPVDLPLPADAKVAAIRPALLEVGAEGGWVALSTWLSALLAARGRDVVRVKGVVRSPAGLLLIQAVRDSVQPPEILPETLTDPTAARPEPGRLVLIGRGFDAERLRRSWEMFGG